MLKWHPKRPSHLNLKSFSRTNQLTFEVVSSGEKTIQYVLFLSIGIALLYLTFRNTNPADLWTNIRSVDGFGYALALGIGFVAIIIRGIRWVQLLASLGYKVSPVNAIQQ